MKTNMGSVDRIIRLIIGLVVIALGIYYGSWWGLLGLVPIITALIGFCGFYVPFGISTCKLKKEA
ncbi:MAG: DUF2892 domain-containing protein [candidate division Zixibacteria bacterium HGW-Zixibacteria-1]|nr:MAG: DUF2892 domain-containing protein [candidate division Zixibacteria bacterium HGW-Zixibacteria-1]